jgi:hypothetical protein
VVAVRVVERRAKWASIQSKGSKTTQIQIRGQPQVNNYLKTITKKSNCKCSKTFLMITMEEFIRRKHMKNIIH